MDPKQEWLSLSEAAALLGVHFTTLRRWSNRGLIEYMRTPGGKRKYRRAALETFLQQHHNPAVPSNALTVVLDTAVTKTRHDLHASGMIEMPWYHRMDDEQRHRLRNSGSRLIALLLQYCARPNTPNSGAEVFLEEARRITAEYGRFCADSGLDTAACIQTFLFFRRPMIDAIYETGSLRALDDHEGAALNHKLTLFLDEVLLAMVQAFQQQTLGKRTLP